METYKDLPVLSFENAELWRAWLEQHHSEPAGVWLKFAKKASGIVSLSYAGALDEALCYGWIDGQAKSIDETYYLQKFTPRRSKSLWSKRNVGKVAELTKAGRMKPSGIAEVEAAKLDGRWDKAYDGPANITVPAEFQTMLDANPKAKEFFGSLNKTNRYAVLWQIQTARKPETRNARMEKLLAMLLEGKKIH